MGEVDHKEDEIITHIYLVRGQKVMLDSDLARIYRVTTGRFTEHGALMLVFQALKELARQKDEPRNPIGF
jgi:hypothetical protein